MKRIASLALIVALAACAGRSGSVVPLTGVPGSTSPVPTTFSIRIQNAAPGVRPQHVSSATLGVGVTTYAQSDTGHATSIGYFGNDVSPTSSACVAGPVFRVCSIQAAAPAGDDEMVVNTYDRAPNGSGFFPGTANVLDTGKVDFTVVEGHANTVSVSLGGVPAQINVAIDNHNAVFDTTLYAGIAYNVEVGAVDASGATIIGNDPYATPITLSTSTNHANFTIDGSASATLVTKPNSVVRMVDSSVAHGLPTLVATGSGGIIGTQNYSVNPIGTTTSFATESGPTALASGTTSNEVGQPGDVFYADANEEIVRFDAITKAHGILAYTGQTPEAFATTAIVQNRFAGIDVSYVTASDGTSAWIGKSDGSSALMDNTVPATRNCSITNASTGDRILACGDTITDADNIAPSTLPGLSIGGITTGANGALFFGYDATGNGGIGEMLPSDLGTTTYTPFALASGRYATAIAACPNGLLYFIELDHATSFAYIGSVDTTGSLHAYAVGGTPTALTCGPNDDVYYGTSTGSIYRVPFSTNVATLVSTNAGGDIGGITLGPDGAIWATSTSTNQLLRIIP